MVGKIWKGEPRKGSDKRSAAGRGRDGMEIEPGALSPPYAPYRF